LFSESNRLFGIGLYIYSGEDLPTDTPEDFEAKKLELAESVLKIQASKTLDELKTNWQQAIEKCNENIDLKKYVNDVVKTRKSELEKQV